MLFEDLSEIPKIARRVGTSIFVIPKETEVEIKNAVVLTLEEKSVISIEQVREVLAGLSLKEGEDRFVLIRPAEKLGPDAANALLKKLEEPGEFLHFVLITEEPAAILPTIRSRAAIYVLRPKGEGLEIEAGEEEKAVVKKLLMASGTELVALAEEIAKKKSGAREYALGILALAVEMLTKSYYITGKEAFLAKLPRFIVAYENIAKNGHIKLQIVANLG